MAASPASSARVAGGLPPPPGFRMDMGFQDEEQVYERQAGDEPGSSGLHGALLPTTMRSELVMQQASNTALMPQPFVAGSTVGVALAAMACQRH